MSLENTHFGFEKIRELLGNTPKKIFFSGVGGISMNSLAKVCVSRGHTVSGYDRTRSPITISLEELGVEMHYESSVEIVHGYDVFVYTVAIPEDDPAYLEAGRMGIPRISRADFLGYIMMGYDSRVGISGMHGKSTTTGITASVYTAAGLDPTVFGGATLNGTSSSNILGGKAAFIFEACEYMDSFLDFYPTTAVVLNIEMDHVDYFHSMEQIRNSFTAFMAKAEFAVVNFEDEDVMMAARKSGAKLVTFGSENSGADYISRGVCFDHGRAEFDILYKGEFLCHAKMNVPGRHLVIDALAVAAASHNDGISGEAIGRGLCAYGGIGRRMELKGKTPTGTDVFDDYAHHPTEIRTTLKTACELGYERTACVFQPHTFSRTAELICGFADVLADNAVDEVILAPIYPAREENIYGVSSEQLCEMITSRGKKCRVIDTFGEIAEYLGKSCGCGDAVFVVGAGDINKVSLLLTNNA
ncbi:MAG: UDP-N-acetylmuramate--L-alanine ligase [Clostridia bacterium]|nr:UDP-N-acetylmuramate--L-alanine ligase [Clostridia bacterium]